MKNFLWLWLLAINQLFALSVPPTDSLPAGTKISIQIQVPGDATVNRINYTIPAPVVVPVIHPVGILYDGQVMGMRSGHKLIVRNVNGQLFLTEDFGTGFLFRGKNLLSRTDAEVDVSLKKLAGQLSGGDTGFDGLSQPAGVSAPMDYVQKTFPDGAVYYAPGDSSPPKPDNTNQVSRLGSRPANTYVLEGAGQFRPEQFGTGKYYDPNFTFSVDFRADRSLDERRAVGENKLQISSLDEQQRSQLRKGEAILYFTESSLHGEIEGNRYYEYTLQDFFNAIYPKIIYAGGQFGSDKDLGLVILNIETSNWWNPAMYADNSHWPSWESVKQRRILCEMDGVTRSLEELAGSGLMEREQNVRRGNRLALEFALLHERAGPNVKFSYGASMWQGQADYTRLGNSQPFLESYPDVSNIGGSSDGTITLNRPGGGTATYKLSGSQYQNEDVMTGYYYKFTYDISGADFANIWGNPGNKTYRDLWAAIKPVGIVADEKGYLQMNQEMMRRKYGKTHPILRLWEPVYEDNMATLVDGVQLERAARTPFQNLHTARVRDIGYGDIPKIWQPPYMAYGRYAVTRFRAGAEPGWGIHIFPAGPTRGGAEWYDQYLHSYTSTYQARADMQELESWYAGSTLVEDPEVKTNGTGDWQALSGPQAYGYHDGVQDSPKVAASLRYKPADDNTTTVYILAGIQQGYTESSTHLVRLPGGGLDGNTFQVQLRGPSAYLYKFQVKLGDTNQTYLGTCVNPVAGYAGLVNNN